MKNQKCRIAKIAGALSLALTVFAGVVRAETPPPSTLAAQWWQWVMEVPVAQCPLLDPTGEFAGVNQKGPVWFLAGNFGGTTVRTFAVPAGVPLFFPVANQASLANTPGYWGMFGNTAPAPLATARKFCHETLSQVTQMSCEIDGVSIPITEQLREQSVPFSVRLAPDNIYGLTGPHLTLPGCVDEGFYLLVPPLSRGHHTIHIFAHNPTTDWTLDVTDHITVQ